VNISVKPDLIKAKHREIAVRYRAGKKSFSMASLRCAELRRLFTDRYGFGLHDDDAGREDARIMAHHLAMLAGDQRVRVTAWLSLWAPWMPADEMTRLIDAVTTKALRWRADTLAERLGLTEADRARLRITTIGAIDMTKDERENARKERKVQAKRKKRREQGVKPRDEYLAAALTHAKPWEAAGCSRATWYRRQGKAQ
jgi:hypothetical protein